MKQNANGALNPRKAQNWGMAPGLIRAAEDLGASAPYDLFQRRPDYVGEGADGAHDARVE